MCPFLWSNWVESGVEEPRQPGESHWDLVFVYAVEKPRPRKMKLPWWKELVFLDRRDLRERDFGWNEDLMKDLDLK